MVTQTTVLKDTDAGHTEEGEGLPREDILASFNSTTDGFNLEQGDSSISFTDGQLQKLIKWLEQWARIPKREVK